MGSKPFHLCLGFVAAALAGCGTSPYPPTVPVTGVVTYQGRPVEGATVCLVPVDPQGRSAAGVTDASGRFSVMTYVTPEHQPAGAMPGTYQITISKQEIPKIPEGLNPGELMVYTLNQPPPKALLPEAYSQPETSGFEITIGDAPPEPLQLDLQ